MPEERRLTIGSTARVTPDDVARHTFGTSRRGFDPDEVRAFLEMVARELDAAAIRDRQLLDALAAAEHRAANPVLDESTLTSALGQETARVLRSAHDAATELMARAEGDAARLRAQADEEAEQIRAGAEQHAAERGTQVEAAANDVRRRLQEEERARLEAAKAEAEALVSQARSECRAMVHEAQELRARVLSDLTRRRRVLHSQIEQLRAGRERLAQTIGDVRNTVDRVTDDLFRAEDEARLAAETAGRQVSHDDEEPLDQLSSVSVREAAKPDEGEPAPDAAAPSPAGHGVDEVSDGDEERRQQAVEELFARLRAEQKPSTSAAVTVLGPAPATSDAEPTVMETGPSALAVVEDDPAAEERAEAGRDPAIARRDELLEPALSGLARKLKRVLADDQNDILDRIRGRKHLDADVLGSEEDHERRYRQAAENPLGDAARAGAAFAGGSLDHAVMVDDVAQDLATSIVAPLRRRLLDQPVAADDEDEAAVSEYVGSAFREWKGQRVERVAADHAHGAFWDAALAVTPKDEQLRWVVDDDGAQCPDCDDNALAGPLPAGETFPTGHVHPPAHPGCRCLLVSGPA